MGNVSCLFKVFSLSLSLFNFSWRPDAIHHTRTCRRVVKAGPACSWHAPHFASASLGLLRFALHCLLIHLNNACPCKCARSRFQLSIQHFFHCKRYGNTADFFLVRGKTLKNQRVLRAMRLGQITSFTLYSFYSASFFRFTEPEQMNSGPLPSRAENNAIN